MKIYDIFEIIQKRLTKKLARARQAFLKENTIKKTQNCVNKGRNLAGVLYHCKINAMGEHEHGASQCWDEKACLCPLFELKYGLEQLDHQFQNMGLEELSIRWPSIGELIRIQDLLSQADEIKHGQDTPRPLHSEKSGHLPASTSEEAGEPGSGVPSIDQHGPGDQSPPSGGVSESGGRDNSGSAELDETSRKRLPLVSLPGPGNRTDSDREKIRPEGRAAI